MALRSLLSGLAATFLIGEAAVAQPNPITSTSRLPLAVAYGIWSGLGMALVAGLGVLWFGERLDWRRIGGLVLIGAGVALANQG